MTSVRTIGVGDVTRVPAVGCLPTERVLIGFIREKASDAAWSILPLRFVLSALLPDEFKCDEVVCKFEFEFAIDCGDEGDIGDAAWEVAVCAWDVCGREEGGNGCGKEVAILGEYVTKGADVEGWAAKGSMDTVYMSKCKSVRMSGKRLRSKAIRHGIPARRYT